VHLLGGVGQGDAGAGQDVEDESSSGASTQSLSADPLTSIAIDGLRAPAARELPGKPPSSRHYEQRWQRLPS
jgi:hypothetical protein